MTAIAAIVAPVFALVALGTGARFWRVVDLQGLRALNDVTFYLLIPSLLFGAVVRAPAGQGLEVAGTYFAGCLLVFGAGLWLSRRLLGARLAQAAVIGLNCAYGNTVMLGVPIVSSAFGADGVAVLLPVIALHSVVLLPVATLLIEAGGAGGGHPARVMLRTLPALGRNPVIAAILLAAAWRGLDVPVPEPLDRLLATLAAAAPAMALLTLGASLPDVATQGSVRETGLAVLGKLVALPLLVWGLARLAGLGAEATAIAVVTAGMPTGANAFFLARRTGTLAAASAGTVVVSTMLSVATTSAALALLR